MLIYKKIDLPQWEFIQQELVRAIDLDSVRSHTGFIPFESQLTPKLDRCLQDLDLVVEHKWIIVYPVGYITMLHTDFPDSSSLKTALNLPVYNCRGSRTEFYQRSVDHPQRRVGAVNLRYYQEELCQDLYLDSFELDQPTLLNTQVPHRVITGSQCRVCVSLRFTREPLKLWNI